MTTASLLIEVGTEELPPKALRALMDAFAAGVVTSLDGYHVVHGAVKAFATPRRLAVIVKDVADRVEPVARIEKGPPVSVAFDADGKPGKAALAFAKRHGVPVDALQRVTTDKGEKVCVETRGEVTFLADMAADIVASALASLPIPRRMRWGAGDAEFVRPVHWLVMLHGDEPIDGEVLGVRSGRTTHGHRFHAPEPITVDSADSWPGQLENEGRVIADFERRRQLVVDGVNAAAREAGGEIVDGDSLYDEVTALVEWPVPLTGHFEAAFLDLPPEVVISTLTGHQRYFPVAGADGDLLPAFVTVANLDSTNPAAVRDGNERVIRPRLADAAFFWDSDRRRGLASRLEALRDVVYQQGLGTLADKSSRVAKLAQTVAAAAGADDAAAARAAELAKCDLLTGMVGEFPDLQGVMGGYYAAADREPEAVSTAIRDQYRPRFAGDALPATAEGRALAVADKLDTLAGIFALGKSPSGNRDPFGLRRAALGVVRILVEGGIDVDLVALLAQAAALQPADKLPENELVEALYTFITERMRRYSMDRDPGLGTETFDAVLDRRPVSLTDLDARLQAVQAFLGLDAAQSLAAANKRIANILRKAGPDVDHEIVAKRLVEPAEQALFEALQAARADVTPLLAARSYTAALERLAGLRAPVDRFFDDVMVMADDAAVRNNRLALLGELRQSFLDIADLSRLSPG